MENNDKPIQRIEPAEYCQLIKKVKVKDMIKQLRVELDLHNNNNGNRNNFSSSSSKSKYIVGRNNGGSGRRKK